MTRKYLITTSLFSLTLVSAVQAADVRIPEQPAPVVPILAAPSFSWTGFYLGGQIGNFSSKTRANYLRDEETGQWFPIDKEYLPKLSGFIGGLYAGSNIDIDNGFIVGIDTDIMWVNKKDTKEVNSPRGGQTEEVAQSSEKTMRAKGSRNDPPPPETSSEIVYHTLKQKWTGATRVRVGFGVDRFMPYVAGGIAYTQLRSTFSKGSDGEKKAIDLSDLLEDEKKTMIGYTFGGGVDFAMTDNIVMRAEYRYSDFGKKKFVHDRVEMRYKTNDFRVGVAYKF